MERSKRSEIISQLKQDGFKMVCGFSSLYINKDAKVFNLKTGKYITPTKRNQIVFDNKYLSVPKLLLRVFLQQPYRDGQIQYIDGNKSNLNIDNLKYCRIFESNKKPIRLEHEKILIAIRCYFQIQKRFNVYETPQTKWYLSQIAVLRGFFIDNIDADYIEVFKTYLDVDTASIKNYVIDSFNISDTAKHHGLNIRDCTIIINQFTNRLINDVIKDLENGLLSIQDYIPKPKTKTEVIKEYNKELVKRGQTPIPLRKKSVKETVKDFYKSVETNKIVYVDTRKELTERLNEALTKGLEAYRIRHSCKCRPVIYNPDQYLRANQRNGVIVIQNGTVKAVYVRCSFCAKNEN